jgi:hypothetical protein
MKWPFKRRRSPDPACDGLFSEDIRDGIVAVALSILNKDARRVAKKQLLENVLTWIISNEEEAKAEFAQSANEVIRILQEIEESLFPANLPIGVN